MDLRRVTNSQPMFWPDEDVLTSSRPIPVQREAKKISDCSLILCGGEWSFFVTYFDFRKDSIRHYHNVVHQEKLNEKIAKCRQFLDYEENWDGYGSPPISKKVVDETVEFLKSIPTGSAFPKVKPTGDNEILCTWEKQDNLMMISFFGDDKYHCYAKIIGEKYYKNDLELIAGAIDYEVLSWIEMF